MSCFLRAEKRFITCQDWSSNKKMSILPFNPHEGQYLPLREGYIMGKNINPTNVA